MESATTPPLDAAPIDAAPRAKHSSTSRQIRGSSLMLVGRALSVTVTFAIQVLVVHHLTKANYGAFAYAMSFVILGQTIATLGLDRAITRFVPIYHEHRDYSKMFGTILMVIGTVMSIGVILIAFVYGFQGFVSETLLGDQEANKELVMALLLILIAMAPMEALDDLIEGLTAIFASPRSIFFRKYILAPSLKLSVVLLLIYSGSDVFFLAGGYLFASALGLTVYVSVLLRVLRKQGLFQHFHFKTLTFPAREIFSFTIPLLTSDLVFVLMSSSDAVLLEHFHSTTEVAAFRVVQPAAILNQFVFQSFTLLFMPLAARMYARNDREGINSLYWQTALWISVLSFPIFAMTFSLAHPITVLLYGQRYEQSAVILALLSVAYYFNAALGFNGLTLKVYGKLRFVVVINILAAAFNIGINLWLIPLYGAFGAALGTSATMIAHNLLKQAGLRLGTGISLFEWRYLKGYLSIIVGALSLLAIQSALPKDYSWTSPYIYISFACASVVALVVVGLNRASLNVGQNFPELLRFPLLRWLFGA